MYSGENIEYNKHLTFENMATIDYIANCSVENLMSIDGIGRKTAESVYNWFRDQNNIDLIVQLKECGVSMN